MLTSLSRQALRIWFKPYCAQWKKLPKTVSWHLSKAPRSIINSILQMGKLGSNLKSMGTLTIVIRRAANRQRLKPMFSKAATNFGKLLVGLRYVHPQRTWHVSRLNPSHALTVTNKMGKHVVVQRTHNYPSSCYSQIAYPKTSNAGDFKWSLVIKQRCVQIFAWAEQNPPGDDWDNTTNPG